MVECCLSATFALPIHLHLLLIIVIMWRMNRSRKVRSFIFVLNVREPAHGRVIVRHSDGKCKAKQLIAGRCQVELCYAL